MPPVGCLEVAGGAPDGGRGGLGPVAAARPDVARAGGRPSATSSAAAGQPGQPLREEGGGVAHDVLVHEAAGDGLDGGCHGGRRVGAAVAEVVGAGTDAGGGAGGGGTVEGAAVAVSPAAAAEGRVSRDGGVGVGGPSRAAVAIFILEPMLIPIQHFEGIEYSDFVTIEWIV